MHEHKPVRRTFPPTPLDFLQDSADIQAWYERLAHHPILGMPLGRNGFDGAEFAADLASELSDLIGTDPDGYGVILQPSDDNVHYAMRPAYGQAFLGALSWRCGDDMTDAVVEDLLRVLVDPAWAEILEPPGPRTVQAHRVHRWLRQVGARAQNHLHDVLEPYALRITHTPQLSQFVVDRLVTAAEPHRPALTASEHGVLFALDGGAGRGQTWVHGQVLLLAHSMGYATRQRDLDLAHRAAVENTVRWDTPEHASMQAAADDADAWLNTRRCPGGFRYDFTDAGTYVLRTYQQTAEQAVEIPTVRPVDGGQR